MADPTPAAATPPGPGGGGSASPPAGTAAVTPPAAGAGNGQAASTPAFRPEGLPDRLYGGSDRETVEKIFTDWSSLRKHESTRGALPEKPEGYKIEWADPIKPYAQGWDNSEFDKQFLSKVRTSAHKHGLGDKQLAGVLNDVLGEMIAGDMIEKPLDVNAERAALVPEHAKGLSAQEQRAAVDKRMGENMAWLEAMVKRDKGLPETAKNVVLSQLGDSAQGHFAIEWFRSQISGEEEFRPTGGGGTSSTETRRAALIARQSDPRADPMNAKYDKKFVADTMELYKQADKDGILEPDRSKPSQ